MESIFVEIEKETEDERPRFPTQPELQPGGPGSGWPPPYRITTGQEGHIVAGIDLGTKLGRIAHLEHDTISSLIPASMPSQVHLDQSGQMAIGYAAPVDDFNNTISSFRSLIGTSWYIERAGNFYNAEVLTRLLLAKLREQAGQHMGRPVSKAVLTVPAYFNSAQRVLLKEIARQSGLEVLQLINESTAAAFSYCWRNPHKSKYLVFHLGAGSFTSSIIDFYDGILEVKSTSATADISGNALDEALIEWMIADFEEQSGTHLTRNRNILMRLLRGAENAKLDLSSAGMAQLRVTYLPTGEDRLPDQSKQDSHLITSINIEQYSEIIAPHVEKMRRCLRKTMEDAGTYPGEIDDILLVGENASIPTITNMLKEELSTNSFLKVSSDVGPVAGASLLAALITNEIRDYIVWDVVSEPVCVDLGGTLKQVVAPGAPMPITAYHKCQSPDATINLNVFQGGGLIPDTAPDKDLDPLAELTINNCPPTSSSDSKVEFAFSVRPDGTVEYSAQHVELQVNLPVSVRLGECTSRVKLKIPELYTLESAPRKFDEQRLERLARKLNISTMGVLNFLRQRGYSVDSINSGEAIEMMLRKLRRQKQPPRGMKPAS